MDTRQSPGRWLGMSTTQATLVLLTLQNSMLILIMHYSRIMPPVKGHRYLPSTAILLNEIIKLSISLTMALYDLSGKHQNSSVTALFSSLVYSVLSPDAWKMAIPAMLYTLQNTLQYIAVSNLDAFIFQITYQLKIITTAMFSVSLLGRALSTRKWLSLLLLTVGVAIVQFPHGSMPMTMSELREDSRSNHWFKRSLERVKDAGAVAVVRLTRRSATYQGIAEDFALHNPTPNFSIGLLAIAVACITSGLAGVYFERVLKYNGSKQPKTSNQSVWVRNVQLSFFSIIPALLLGVMYKDGETIAHTGFFAGYNWIVWLAIALQAAGGILVALVISHANNIAKNFATSISVVISFLASVVFFDLEITFTYIAGASIVVIATWLYSRNEGPRVPAVVVAEHEKSGNYSNPEYFDIESTSSFGRDLRAEGLSTSRPTTPTVERHHFRSGSQRRQFEKRDL